MTTQICLGLTGRMGSGKGEVVKILEENGYKYISLSDIVREEVRRSGRDVTRYQMQDVGNRLRQEGGSGVLGSKVREKVEASDTEKWIIDGIRNPAEVEQLRKMKHFQLLAVDADIDTLMQRIKNRKRDTDMVDENELKKTLDREWGIGEPEGGQQVGKCMEMADHTIHNNNSLDDLKQRVFKLLEELNVLSA